ncbi:hypothetical protein CHAB381_1687 [Campylobacter hominis ATCC BAA-381]|uniref:Uncharacterized protein n=1 Tax=Campylobacter hominis (strain ATCC BAA-381 / DSM 21671 / CCUG 45161 / LMG 19568 / NCTC 13146 / CH001A) TaxID=360107 RepID=A7I3V8_CAMHC|nr:hypothetical protein CHAB381_1687 [Campylobacter hominis ATCC BAA-381]
MLFNIYKSHEFIRYKFLLRALNFVNFIKNRNSFYGFIKFCN